MSTLLLARFGEGAMWLPVRLESDSSFGYVIGHLVEVDAPVRPLGRGLRSVFFGIATPTEGGAIGVTCALLLGLARRKLTGRNLRQAMDVTGILVSGIIFLLMGASFFTLVFRGLDGHVWIEHLFSAIPAGQLGFILFTNAAIFLLAFFLDFFEIAFIVLPLIAPIARELGIDMVWLAVLLAVNLQTSFMLPPFGIALYNLRSVTPARVRTAQIYWGAVPFLCIQLLVVALLIAVPEIVTRPSASPTGDNVEIDLPPPPESENEGDSDGSTPGG